MNVFNGIGSGTYAAGDKVHIFADTKPQTEETVVGDMDGNGKIRWDASLTIINLDFANLDAMIAMLCGNGTIATDTPLFALGMSNGGSFSVSLGAVSSTLTYTARAAVQGRNRYSMIRVPGRRGRCF